jgi:2-dehydropantoate 2-reductase
VSAQSILIYGAGGVGAFFGALLVRAGRDVHFVARGAQLDAIRRDGLRVRSSLIGDVHVPRVQVYARAADAPKVDLALVCVKTYQTDSVLDDLAASVQESTIIVTLQNGVESDEVVAARFGWSRVLPAAVYVGATIDEPGVVAHEAPARISFGARPGFDPARLEIVREVLAATGQRIQISDDIQHERWRKLVWNASFNTVSAITMRAPADLLALPETRALLRRLMQEVVDVARAVGIGLVDGDVDDHISWTERAPGMRTSTMVDRSRGRTMEADALIGVIVRKGRERGVATPASETMYALMKASEAGPR